MKFLKLHLSKFIFGTVAVLALATMLPDKASASRYAMAYFEFNEICIGNPGNDCDDGG